jgi:hypothetical protein
VFSPRTLRNVVSVNKEVFTINFEVSWVLGPQFSTKISFDTGSLQTMLNESSVYFELLNLTTTVGFTVIRIIGDGVHFDSRNSVGWFLSAVSVLCVIQYYTI